MNRLPPLAPLPIEAPIPRGTRVELDPDAKFLDRDLLSGGSPWRLLRLPGGSRVVAERWRGGGEVRAGEERFARTLVQQGLVHPAFHHAVDMDEVDVVVPVRDDLDGLEELLDHLAGLHVTVVDDESSDAHSIEACANRFGAHLVRLERNIGPAGARNAGAAATSRPLLWFIDADVDIENAFDVLARLQTHFDDPLVGAVAPRIRGARGKGTRDRFERSFSPLDMGERSALAVPRGPVGYVPSACLIVRRDSFADGFDEELRLGEDVDLVWRLHDRGWLVRYDANVLVTHRARRTWLGWWCQRIGYGLSSSELAQRHGSRLAPLQVDAWTLAAWLSLLAGRPVVAGRIVRMARNRLGARMAQTTDEPDRVAKELVGRGMVRAGGPLARAVVRTFGPILLLVALHPKVRRRALGLYVVGTAWRWRSTRVRLTDVPLAVADDLAYGLGVWRGAWRSRSFAPLKPRITKSTLGLRDALGLRAEPASR